jgi:hypothetical protein
MWSEVLQDDRPEMPDLHGTLASWRFEEDYMQRMRRGEEKDEASDARL